MERTDSRKKVFRVLIVDDHAMTRYGLAQLVAMQPDLTVCGEASGVSEALQLIETTQPDLAVIDLSLGDGNGLELIGRIKEQLPNVRMLVTTMHDECLFADRSLRAGAMGYILKNEPVDKVLEAIRQVLKGKTWLSPEMHERLIAQMVGVSQKKKDLPSIDRLSNRELEVFELIGRGLTRSQVAARLNLSCKTIESHQEKIKIKMMLKTSHELFRRAVEWVLVQEGR